MARRDPSPAPLDKVLRSAEADALAVLTEQEEEERQAGLLHKVHQEWGRVRHFCADGEEVFAERLCRLLAAVREAGLIDRLDQLQPGDAAKQAALAVYRSADAGQCNEVVRSVRSLAQSVRRSRRAGAAHIELRDWLCGGLMKEILADSSSGPGSDPPRGPQPVTLDPSAAALADTDYAILTVLHRAGRALMCRQIEQQSAGLRRSGHSVLLLSERVVRGRVPHLLAAGLVERPPGTRRKGVGITPKGISRLAEER
jgi:hypothetical protein